MFLRFSQLQQAYTQCVVHSGTTVQGVFSNAYNWQMMRIHFEMVKSTRSEEYFHKSFRKTKYLFCLVCESTEKKKLEKECCSIPNFLHKQS